MAKVTFIIGEQDGFRDGMFDGELQDQFSLTDAAIPTDWTAAGSPQRTIARPGNVCVIVTDVAIEVAFVRSGAAPTTVVAHPIPSNGSLTGYALNMPNDADHLFVRLAP